MQTVILAVLLPAVALAQVPSTIAYQGRLLDAGGNPQSGVVTMQFAVFDVATAGTSLWCETQTVALTDGYYAVSLGGGAPCGTNSVPLHQAFAGTDRWLEISVASVPLTPRQKVGAVPYAYVASALAGGGSSFIQSQSTTEQSASFRIAGSATVTGTPAFAGAGTVATTNNSPAVTGTGTQFGSQVALGDLLTINGQAQHVIAITDATHLTVDAPWTANNAGLTYQVQKAVAQVGISTTGAPPALLVNEAGKVGIGTASPNAALDIAISNTSSGIRVESTNSSLAYPNISLEDWVGTTTGHPYIGMGNYGGTKAAPTATPAGRVLGTFIAFGHDGNATVQSGRITFLTEATFTPTSNPTSIVFAPGGAGSYSEVMRLRSDGKVGIGLSGAAPTHAFQLGSDDAAKPSGGSWTASSDIRLKKNVKPMTAALDRLAKLQGVTFEWIHPEEHGNNTGTQGGFIAQEVEEIFPSWVTRSDASPKDKGLVGADKVATLGLPFEFDALVVESLKELRAENQALKARNAALEQQNREFDARLRALESGRGLQKERSAISVGAHEDLRDAARRR